MSVRKKVKDYKARFKQGTRRIFEDKASSVQPTESVPNLQNSSSSTIPAPSSLPIPLVTDPVPRPRSAPLSSDQSAVSNKPLPSTSAQPTTSPSPQAAVSDPSPSARPAPAPPDANTSQSGLEPLQVLTTVSALLGPLQPVINDLLEFFEAYMDAVVADSDYAALKAELKALLNTLKTFSDDVPPIITDCVSDLGRSINEELDKVARRERAWAGRRVWEANEDLDKARACRDQIRGHVNRITLKTGLHTAKLAKEQATENQLKALKPSLAACYNSSKAAMLLRRECTPNTREGVLSDLAKWRHDAKQGNIFWMNGMAGTGKTTIANTLCATLETEQRLGASFFCTRQLPECRNVDLILPTIAYQLARYSGSFRNALCQAVESNPDLCTRDLPTQLEGLIIGPLRESSERLPGDLVVVIDALDECEDHAGVAKILELLVRHVSELPIKVFVSSRPEEEIRKKVGNMESRVVLHELDKKIVTEDIEVYLREELKDTVVSEIQPNELVKRAGVLFIYAATVARFIKAKPSHSGQQERLKIVLNTSSTSSSRKNEVVDALYSAVLESAFSKPGLEDFEKDRMSNILHMVVCAQEPLTADALAGLLQLDDGDLVLDALEPLWSVLHVSGSGGASLVTTLHASFPDYLFDTQRSHGHCCNATSRHGRLAELCFERIEGNDKLFNICGLDSSYLFDEEVPDLDERVKLAIPLDLSYACQYWAVHLGLGGGSSDRIQLLEIFLSKRLLLWMEVLNLKKRMNLGAVLLEKARKWCSNGGGSEAILGLIQDAWRFVTTFAANPVSRSTPHLYLSMLPFWPSSKLLLFAK